MRVILATRRTPGVTCLGAPSPGARPVTVILIRDRKTGYDLTLVTTEQNPNIATVIERYAARWQLK
jgi:hypothetical protein